MGYTTEFKGVLKFGPNMSVNKLAHLNTILGEDTRDHPEWDAPETFCHIDLQVAACFSGIEWTGMEKSYSMDDQVRTVLRMMQDRFPDFTLSGEMLAQGELASDAWTLKVENGKVEKIKHDVGPVITCPNCHGEFALNRAAKVLKELTQDQQAGTRRIVPLGYKWRHIQ